MNDIKKAIEALEELNIHPDQAEDTRFEMALIIALRCMQQQLTNGWTPVSERLPEKDGWYEITVYRKIDNVYFTRVVKYEGDFWYYEDGEVVHGKITAWRERPKPYIESN
jgi:hypothetical protein